VQISRRIHNTIDNEAGIGNTEMNLPAVQGHTESIEIDASAQVLYDLVADVTAVVERSPEVRRCEWIGEPAAPVVGARFRGYNRWRGFGWSRLARVTVAEPAVEFAFETIPGRGIYHDVTRWRYRFEPSDGGTRVVETYEFHAPGWLRHLDAVLGRLDALAAGMRATLTSLKRAAEHGR
jgi:hypothetical protein